MIKKISMIPLFSLIFISVLQGGVSQAASINRTSHTAKIVGSGARVQKSFSLNVSQLKRTISTVNSYINQSTNGTVVVSSSILRKSGLTTKEVSWAQHAMHTYDQEILSGKTSPSGGAFATYNVPPHTATAVIPLSTYGFDYTWYIARTPYWYTEYFWWGWSKMGNNTATKNLATNLNYIATGAGAASLFPWEGSWLVGLGGMAIGAYANQINSTNAQGGYYGVHLNFVLGNPLPVGIYANVP